MLLLRTGIEHRSMAENGDEKGTGAWAKVPVWDGAPTTWRSFKREMTWWVSSLDLESTKRYNLAARWLLRQSGIVRQRGEEFSPSELAYKPATKGVDPQTGDEIVLEPEDWRRSTERRVNCVPSFILELRERLENVFLNSVRGSGRSLQTSNLKVSISLQQSLDGF